MTEQEPKSECCGADAKYSWTWNIFFCSKCHKPAKIKMPINVGSDNPMWKGDVVGYFAVHDYVRRRLPKPSKCSLCNDEKRFLDLSNISGTYKRDLSDWQWICRKCHMKLDGRYKRFLLHSKYRRLKDKTCLICGKTYKPKRETTETCSKSCAGKLRYKRGVWFMSSHKPCSIAKLPKASKVKEEK